MTMIDAGKQPQHRRRAHRAPGRSVAAALALAVLFPCPGTGQSDGASTGEAGALAGAVVDAETGLPVAGASVVMEPETGGAFPGTATSSSFLTTSRTATTGSDGRYWFDGLTPGVYRLYVTRLGYQPYSVVVELRGGAASVSIGLEADPIALRPLRGASRGAGPYVAADAFGADTELGRRLAADLRRRRYLTTDVRELTHADVIEGVTLGEPDVLRALQRLPGVTTRSDYTAELWTRGAPWSHTRVYFDGVPVYNPLHALGVLSGISSSALGTVWFYPGVRPASIGEGAAGVIDLRSRPATGSGELNLQADVSLLTAGLALDQRVLDGRAGWMLSGRRSYLDWLSRVASHAADEEDAFPYGFSEVSGQADLRLGDRHLVEGSWLWEGDELHSVGDDGGAALRAVWGNAVGRATWSFGLGSLNVQHSVAGSGHHARIRERPASTQDMTAGDGSLQLLGESLVQYLGLRGSVWPEPRSLAGPAWSAGYSIERHQVDYFGPQPLPVPRFSNADLAQAVGGEGGLTLDTTYTAWDAGLTVASLWAERTWTVDDRLSLRGGLRLEAGEEVRNGGPIRFSPRASVRYAVIPELAVSAGYSRVHQYTQAVAPAGVHLASLVSTDAWIVAGPGIPAIASDHLTAGLEAWVATDRSFTLNGFARRSTGVVLPSPVPGPVFGRARNLVDGENTAYGIEAAVRQLGGPVTGSIAYSLSRSRTRADDIEFVSGADRTHVFDAVAMVHPIEPLRFGAAFTAATGVPFTRTVSTEEECAATPGCDPEQLPWAGLPNGARAPTFASLDLLVDWTTEMAGLQVGVYGQLRNVLGRENATIYTGAGTGCLLVGCSVEELRNAYERGVPRLPVVGIRVRR